MPIFAGFNFMQVVCDAFSGDLLLCLDLATLDAPLCPGDSNPITFWNRRCDEIDYFWVDREPGFCIVVNNTCRLPRQTTGTRQGRGSRINLVQHRAVGKQTSP